MADKDTEWNVPSSDGEEEEEDSCEAAQSQGEEKWEVPLKVLLLYSEIEKKGFVELKVKECRSGEAISLDVPKSCTINQQESPTVSDPAEADDDPEISGNDDTLPQNIEKEK